MTGTRLLLTLTLELRRRGVKRGLATACIGGGQGIAAIVETSDVALRRQTCHVQTSNVQRADGRLLRRTMEIKTVGVSGLWTDGLRDCAGVRGRRATRRSFARLKNPF